MRLNLHTSISRQLLPRLVLAGLVSALLAGCGNGAMNNSNFTGTIGGGGSIVGTTDTSGGTSGGGTTSGGSAQCTSTDLAAVDLSGQCRATPQATMGALEVVGG